MYLTAITMSKIIECVYKNCSVACAKWYSCQYRPDPMYWRHTGPSKPQLSDRSQNSSDTNDAGHGFGWYFASLRVFHVRVDHSSKQLLGAYNQKTSCGDFGVSLPSLRGKSEQEGNMEVFEEPSAPGRWHATRKVAWHRKKRL